MQYNADEHWIENNMLTKRRRTQKATYYMTQTTWMSRLGKSVEIESRLMAAREAGGRRAWGATANGCGAHVVREEMIWNEVVMIAVQPCGSTLKNIKLYTLKWRILWYIYYISMKNYCFKNVGVLLLKGKKSKWQFGDNGLCRSSLEWVSPWGFSLGCSWASGIEGHKEEGVAINQEAGFRYGPRELFSGSEALGSVYRLPGTPSGTETWLFRLNS